MKKSGVIKNQELFFNLNSQFEKKIKMSALLNNYVNKEQIKGFKWISDSKTILEYGTGTGLSLDRFFKNRNQDKYHICGVDIAELAINKAKINYPKFQFYKISNNKIPHVKNGSFDTAFMFHVLHHSRNHIQIFKEISLKLKKGGKFLINDLSSNSIFHRLGRFIFIWLPKSMQIKFSDDLVIDGNIPDKYKVDINLIISQLKKSGFKIEEVGHGHLFFFVFAWVDRFIPLSNNKIISYIYKKLIDIEKYLLQYDYFKKQAEVFTIKCIKKS